MTAFMINVILPTSDANAAAYMQAKLDSDFNIYLVYSTVADASNPAKLILYTRLSSQVYLELRDFTQLKELVPQLLQEYADQKHKLVGKSNFSSVVEVPMMGVV
jgi:hypothetical protein